MVYQFLRDNLKNFFQNLVVLYQVKFCRIIQILMVVAGKIEIAVLISS